MGLSISDDLAMRFANALIVHSGNRTQAAIACGYAQGSPSRVAGHDLARHPKVLECLDPLLHQSLKSLTPKAITTLAGLLNHKSGYIRLEAAKDILDRNGVGTSQTPMQAQPFLIRINLGATNTQASTSTMLIDSQASADASDLRPGGRKSEKAEVTSTPAHDFSLEASRLSAGGGLIDAESARKPVEEKEPYRWELD